MRLIVNEGSVEIRLSRWQKVLGLLRDITIPREAIGAVEVVDEPVREAMSAGIKVGLRLPWLYYVARTIRLDQAFVVRRGVPGLSLSIHDGGPLQRVIVSTPDAAALAAELSVAR